jgi:hypothetical protein
VRKTHNQGASSARRAVQRAAVLAGIVIAGVVGATTPALAAAGQAGGTNYFECQIKRSNYAAAGYSVTSCTYYPRTGNWLFFYSKLQVG